jgi:hypothetical protein
LSGRNRPIVRRPWNACPLPTDLIDKKVVVNLPNKELDPAAVSILAKGLNFAHMTNPTSNIRDVISGIERVVLDLPMEVAEEMRNLPHFKENQDAEE